LAAESTERVRAHTPRPGIAATTRFKQEEH